MKVKKVDLEFFILKLFEKMNRITLQDVAEATGLSAHESKNRRAIQRAFTRLIQQGRIKAQGAARARVYISEENSIKDDDLFKGIALSKPSIHLLRDILQPIHTRKPVAYNQDFLRSYRPNESAYLSPSIREALSKLGQTGAIIQPAGTYVRSILNRLLIDLSWNSSRLEGNTYSLLETKRLIELGENAQGKNMMEAQMILNHKDALEYIIDLVNEPHISAHNICSLHALLSNNLLGDPSASGRTRQVIVGISGTTYLPLENPHVIKECFDMLISKMNLIDDPFEQSFFSLVHLSYLQAFEDVNKRTARLVANIPFIKKNLRPLSFTDIRQQDYAQSFLGIYEKNDVSLLRDLYCWAYQRSSQRYSALQQAMGVLNPMRLTYRAAIQNIVQHIILNQIKGSAVVASIRQWVDELKLSDVDAAALFEAVETDLMNLHEGNCVQFKIKSDEFERWKRLQ